MSAWTTGQLRTLRDELAKGRDADLRGLARGWGRSLQSVKAMATRHGMHKLKIEPCTEAGVRCVRCGDGFLWRDTPTDPLLLLRELKTWETAHRRCGREA
jgi:hypothetical protein